MINNTKNMAEPPADDVLAVLQRLKNHPRFSKNITYIHHIRAKPAEWVDFPEGIEQRLIEALNKKGILRLLSHQADAIQKIRAGKNVIIATPTASGKTLCYNLPVLDALLKQPDETRAVYLFPTKSLSHDQYHELYELINLLNADIKTHTFDGDTAKDARKKVRLAGQIVLTNPDMLHTGILPHHTLWSKLFSTLRFIVIDEVHTYRGVFGSHFANVIRRLKRVCKFYNSHPQFICCSATIGNPLELAENLIEEDFELIERSGAPQGEKYFIFYNPPLINQQLGIRASVKNETRRLILEFLARRIQTILFGRSRINVEVMTRYLKEAVVRLGQSPEQVRGYRGGYLPNERRAIEQGIKKGEVLTVVSTNALELGIDIGQLKAALLMGYPGTIASTWQQAGRAGRKAETSIAILIAGSSPLDQYIINHPEYFFGRSPELGIINPNNAVIVASHIKCAAFELPFEDNERFGKYDPLAILTHLEQCGILRHVGNKWYWASERYPAEDISLRSASAENFVIQDVTDRNRVIGEVDYDSAQYLIFPEAIYLHQSASYIIEKLDWENRTAYARPKDVDYYTEAQAKTDVKILMIDHSADFEQLKSQPDFPFVRKRLGDVNVTTIVSNFKKIKFDTHENVGWGEIHLPPLEMQTESYWLVLNPDFLKKLRADGSDSPRLLLALGNLLTNVVPLYVMCDPKDFAVVTMLRSPVEEAPTIFIYDKYPGGINLARRIFTIDYRLFPAAFEIVKNCPCAAGCPSCVGPPEEVTSDAKNFCYQLLERFSA